MARFLIVVPPLAGHVAPLAGIAAALLADGHDVAWVGSPRVIGTVAGPAATVYRAGPDPDGPLPGRPGGLRNFAALEHLWERFLVPLARDMLPAVSAAVGTVRPDVVLCDQQALAGPLAAQRHDVAWVTSASTSTELADPLAGTPRIAEWVDGLQRVLRSSAGLPEQGPDLRFSPLLTLCYSCPGLAGAPEVDTPVRMVGAVLTGRTDGTAFPWEALDPVRRPVLVTLGTANEEAGARFLTACRVGLAQHSDRIQPVVVDPSGTGEPAGPGELVVGRVPQLALLRRVAAVVTHGGHNTVVESLAHGVPLVVAPIRDDQPAVARQVVAAGAGVRVRFDLAGPDQLAAAVVRVLDEPRHGAAAARLADELAAGGGAIAAVTALTALVGYPSVGV